MEKNSGPSPTEQFPLLKVDGGGGDSSKINSVPTAVPRVHITSRRRSFFKRWPEIVSICWMTVILMVIGALAFTVSSSLSFKAFKKTRHVRNVTPCSSQAPSEVFYHHLVHPDSKISLLKYTDYLTMMTDNYPEIQFQIYFLVDDSMSSMFRSSMRKRIYRNLLPYTFQNAKMYSEYEQYLEREVKQLLKSNYNINVNVASLSSFMATTPLKYQWRTMSPNYLMFYIRVFSVWQNGGISLDLAKYYTMHNIRRSDFRIDNIFRQFNEESACKVDYDENNNVSTMLSDILSMIWKESEFIFNRTLLHVDTGKNHKPDEPLVRKHRNKRSTSDDIHTNVISNTAMIDDSTKSSSISEVKKQSEATKPFLNRNIAKQATIPISEDTAVNISKTANSANGNNTVVDTAISAKNNSLNVTEAKGETPKVFLLYDFSIYSDLLGPSYMLNQNPLGPVISDQKPQPRLTLLSDGSFVSTNRKQHPFLGKILSSCSWIIPRYTINNVYTSQCTGIFRSSYCSSIDILA